MSPVYAIVRVEWIDSAGTSGWRTISDAAGELSDPDILDCVSVGFLIAEDERAVMLAQGLGHGGDNVDMTILIPRVAIRSIEALPAPVTAPEPGR